MRKPTKPRAFTILELLCVIAIITILAALLLPALSRGTAKAKRIQCMNGLHQMGLAFHMFAQDHNNSFPISSIASQIGSTNSPRNVQWFQKEFYFGYRPFLLVSNELGSSKLLVCPTDDRQATNFSAVSDRNVSYFLGLKADYLKPQSLVAGDRNITNDSAGRITLVQLGPNQPLRWTSGLHGFQGNLLFADGSVQRSRNLAGTGPTESTGSGLGPSQSARPNSSSGPGVVARATPQRGMSDRKASEPQPMVVPVGPFAGVSLQTSPVKSVSVTATQSPPLRVKAATNSVIQAATTKPVTNEVITVAPEESVGMVTIKHSTLSNHWLWILLLLLLVLAVAVAEYWRRKRRQRKTSSAAA